MNLVISEPSKTFTTEAVLESFTLLCLLLDQRPTAQLGKSSTTHDSISSTHSNRQVVTSAQANECEEAHDKCAGLHGGLNLKVDEL